jgi:hypothetical protein
MLRDELSGSRMMPSRTGGIGLSVFVQYLSISPTHPTPCNRNGRSVCTGGRVS